MNRLQRFTIGIVLASLALAAAACGGGSSSSSSSGGAAARARTSRARRSPCSCPTRCRRSCSTSSPPRPASRSTTWSPAGTRPTTSCWSPTRRRPTSPTWPSSTGRSPASSPAPAGWSRWRAWSTRRRWTTCKSTDAAFISGGKTYAACYSNDFRVSMYNKAMFAKAGHRPSSRPRSTSCRTAVQKLKASGVQYPLSIPMAATEGGVTPWYLLTLAMGGQLFDENINPIFSDPELGRLQGAAVGGRRGQERLGLAGLGVAGRLRRPRTSSLAGENAILLATGPGNMPTANDPSQSSIAGEADARPGARHRPARAARSACPRASRSRSPPSTRRPPRRSSSGGSSPRTRSPSTRRRAACPAARPRSSSWPTAASCRAATSLNQELPHVGPLFPAGAPIWYSQFSSDAQGLLNAAVKGEMSVAGRAQPAR